MVMKKGMSKITLRNWWIDAVLFISAFTTALSGVYFLYFPSGGFQGGRNPYYNLQVLFSRYTWDDLHTWGGVVMIVIAAIHLTLHWPWVVSMARRMFKDLIGRNGKLNRRGRLNLLLNVLVGLTFLVTAVSGIFFLFVSGGRWAFDPGFIFSRTTWDLIHTWAGIILVASALVHFAIHWRWVVNVSKNVSQRLFPQARPALAGPVLSEKI